MLPRVFQVTRQRNTTVLFASLIILLFSSSQWLFGLVWTLILCAISGLSFCCCAYISYRLEAREWREKLSEWYDRLFVWGFTYSTNRHPQGNHKNDHTHFTNSHTPIPSESPQTSTKGELSSGVTLNDQRPPQPQALGQETSDTEGEGLQPMHECHREAQKIIQHIMKDFIQTWYTNVTSDTEFPEDVQKILEHVALEINVRLQQIDYQESVVELLELILPYLEVLNEAGIRNLSGVKLFDVTTETCVKQFEANSKVAHYAMKSPFHEKRHYRQTMDALIQCAFPPEYAKCDVACMLVRELLITNLFEPLFQLLCDPAFLYEAIPLILTKATDEKISRQLDDIEQENQELERILSRGRLIVMMGSQGQNKRRFYTTSGRFGQGTTPSPMLRKKGRGGASRPNSIAVFPHMKMTSCGVYESSSLLTQSSRTHRRHNTIAEGSNEATYPPPTTSPKKYRSSTIRERQPSLAQNRDFQYLHGSAFGSDVFTTVEISEEEEEEEEEEDNCPDSFDNMVDADFAVVELSPIFIERHVRVEDPGAGTYIAYIFKFPKWMLDDRDLEELGVLYSDTHLEGIKRYRDFNKFHNILLSTPSLTGYSKGLDLPEKRHFSSIISKLPFTSSEPDTAVIIERKQGLEKYLQSISSVEAIVGSDLFHQFLKSAVQDLKEANVVNPNRSKKQNRMSFLGRVKGEDTHQAEPVPKRPLLSVLSSYLNTHLPLPCLLNSPHLVKKRMERVHSPALSPSSSPTKLGDGKKSTQRNNVRVLGSLPKRERGSAYSLASSGPNSQAIASSTNRSHSFHGEFDSLHRVDQSERAAIVDPSGPHQGTEVVLDTGSMDAGPCSMDGAESAVSSHSSRRKSVFQEEEEEGYTIGSVTSSVTSQTVPPEHGRHTPNLPPGDVHSLTHLTPPATPTGNSSQVQGTGEAVPRLQSLFYKFLLYAHHIITWLIFIIQRGIEPRSKLNVHALIKVERVRSPLTNILFSLGSEASLRHCPQLWACSQDTQLSLLVLVGGGVERYLWKELNLMVCDEVNWTRALYSLRHTLWPGGVFIKTNKKKHTEEELEQLKRKAADSFKRFLPSFLPRIVGTDEYDRAVVHCLDCLRNPRLNRHFLLRVVDLMVVKIIPEIGNGNFQKHLSQLRTLRPTHGPV